MGADDQLIVCVGQRLLRLDDFNTVSHPGSEPLLRAREVFVGELDVFTGNRDLLSRRLQVEQRCADVVVNLPAEIVPLGATLLERRLRFRLRALDASAGEHRH